MSTTLFKLAAPALALESIAFQQDPRLFKAMTAQIHAMRELKDIDKKTFFESGPVKDLLKLIKQQTNISIKLTEGDPAIYPPILTGNHIFYDRDVMQAAKEWGIDTSETVTSLMKKLKQPVLKGEVDLMKAKVSGVFADMELNMMMPKAMFLNAKPYEAEEVAAIMLHELGHAFTFMEFVSRAVSTNQSLSLLTRLLDRSIEPDRRVVLFTQAGKELQLSKEKQAALTQCQNPHQLSVILIDAAIEKSISELGGSLYDVNSCEYLADQFATRMGAGRYLVTGLDKLMRSTSYKVISFISFIVFTMSVISSTIASGGLLAPVWLLILIAGPNKRDDIYDNAAARMNRVKLQHVEQLKDPTLPAAVRRQLLQEIEAIDAVAKTYKDNLVLFEKLAYYIRPGYRNAHKYEQLQKDLENLSTSSLFTAAAKLQTV